MIVRITLCLACSLLPAQAAAQRAPILQPIPLVESPTPIEAAVASFGICARREIRTLPGALQPDTGAAQVLESCSDRLARVEREAVRVIDASRLSEPRKAAALRDLRARLRQVEARLAQRIGRRGGQS